MYLKYKIFPFDLLQILFWYEIPYASSFYTLVEIVFGVYIDQHCNDFSYRDQETGP
jgi:hypothetical protein